MFDTLAHGRKGIQPRPGDRAPPARSVPFTDLSGPGTEEWRSLARPMAQGRAAARVDEAPQCKGRLARASDQTPQGRLVISRDTRGHTGIEELALTLAERCRSHGRAEGSTPGSEAPRPNKSGAHDSGQASHASAGDDGRSAGPDS